MKVDSVEVFVVPLKPSKLVADSTWTLATMGYTIARVSTDDGLVGIGWTYDVGGEAIRELVHRNLRGVVVGRDPFETESIWQDASKLLRGVGRKGLAFCAISIVDVALWDIKAQSIGRPLFQLLGGSEKRLPIYGSGGWTSYTEVQLIEEVQEMVAAGFSRVKIKVGVDSGRSPLEDVRRVKAVRRAVGDEIELMIDANNAWDVATAVRVGRALEEAHLTFFEEPVIADDLQGLAAVRARTGIPVATGEHEYLKYGARDLVLAGAADIIQMDASKCGGVTEWLKIAAVAQAWNLPVAPHAMHHLHMHLMSAAPNGLVLEYLLMHKEINDAVFVGAPEPEGGYLRIPDRPGIGITLNEAAVRKLAVA